MHDTEMLDGIPIDRGLVTLIDSLWTLGLKTVGCCEANNDGAGYGFILFPNAEDAVEFMRVTKNGFEHQAQTFYSGLAMVPVMKQGCENWSVRFEPSYIHRITDIWVNKVAVSSNPT